MRAHQITQDRVSVADINVLNDVLCQIKQIHTKKVSSGIHMFILNLLIDIHLIDDTG